MRDVLYSGLNLCIKGANSMRRQIILLCSTFLAISSAEAMDLKEALASTYKTNSTLHSAQQKFLSDIEAFPQALASFLPDISLEVDTTTSKQTNTGKSSPGVTNNGPDVSRILTVQQNVFNGGRSVLGLKIAQSQFLQSKATLYSAEQKALSDGLAAYLGLCAAKAKYDIAIASVEFYTQSLNQAREQLKVGEATLTDVAAAEAKFAQSQSNKSQQHANLFAAQASFKSVVGAEPSDDIVFPSIPDSIPETMEAFEAMVEKSNFDLIYAKSQLTQAKDGVKSSKGALLPTATLAASAGRNYYDPESSPTSVTQRNNSRNVTAKLAVNIPILSKGGVDHSKIRQAKASSRQSVYILENVKKQVHSNVVSSWENFIALKDALASTDEAIRAQTLAVEGVKSGYDVGTQTMLDVLTQQDQLNQIQSQAVDLKSKYLSAAYDLKSLMGQMTAKQLKLNAKYFNPDYEFRNVKHKIVGF